MIFDIFNMLTAGAAGLAVGLTVGSELGARRRTPVQEPTQGPAQVEAVVDLDLSREVRRLAEIEGLVSVSTADMNRVLQRITEIS